MKNIQNGQYTKGYILSITSYKKNENQSHKVIQFHIADYSLKRQKIESSLRSWQNWNLQMF